LSRRMENGGTNSINGCSNPHYKNNKPGSLTIDTNTSSYDSRSSDEEYNLSASPSASVVPQGIRGRRDLRSPGIPKTPLSKQAAKVPQDGTAFPDFITQTDANGNATTPRSAQAIEGARKIHPTGPKPHLHITKDGKLSEDDDKDEERKDMMEETCVTIVDSIKLMCCCFMPPDSEKCLTSNITEDSDDKSRIKLLGALHPEDSGKMCLVLDLDETLVHSSFRAVPEADFVIPVQVR
jgi:hypothetical protein